MENENFEIITWVKFKKPGLKAKIEQIGAQCEDRDEFRSKLVKEFEIDLSTAYILAERFFKEK